MSDPLAISQCYFDAWRRRDAAAVTATLAPGGTYEDPLTGGAIAGTALERYMQGLWAALPDLDFELAQVCHVADGTVHAEWTMTGHNHGDFNGVPATGRAVRLPGFDVIRVGADGIRSVRGYFDSAAVPRQLGLDVVVQPSRIGAFELGTALVVRREQPLRPGVLAFTELVACGDANVPTIRELGRQTVAEQLDNPAFLGFTGAVTGRRMTTVSAWASHEALSVAMRSGTHARAMRSFWRDGIADGGVTAGYAPVHLGPHWRRCGACGAMTRLDAAQGACSACAAPLAALA